MNFAKTGILLASAATVLALAACDSAKDASQSAKSPTVATVNGKAITQRTIDMIAAQGAGSGRPDTPESRKAMIDQMALQMVVAEEAVKKGLDKTPEVAEQLEAIRQSVLANAYVQDFIKTNTVTDDMLKAEYDRIKATVSGTEYKARHILVDKEADAKDIIAKLKSEPAAFEKLAMQKSKDPGSKVRGGDHFNFRPCLERVQLLFHVLLLQLLGELGLDPFQRGRLDRPRIVQPDDVIAKPGFDRLFGDLALLQLAHRSAEFGHHSPGIKPPQVAAPHLGARIL